MASSLPSPYKFPKLLQVQAGRMSPADVRQDALGRRVMRMDESKANAGDYRPSQGGTPQPRGKETYGDDVREAARMDRLSPQVALRAMKQVRQVPNTKGGMFNLTPQEYRAYLPETGGRRPNHPRLQALAGLRKMRRFSL